MKMESQMSRSTTQAATVGQQDHPFHELEDLQVLSFTTIRYMSFVVLLMDTNQAMSIGLTSSILPTIVGNNSQEHQGPGIIFMQL